MKLMRMESIQFWLTLIILVILVASFVAYLNPIKVLVSAVLNRENMDEVNYLNPILSLIKAVYKYQAVNTSAILAGEASEESNYLSPILSLSKEIYLYQSINESATLSELSLVNSSMYSMLMRILSELAPGTSAVLNSIKYYSGLTLTNLTSEINEASLRILRGLEDNGSAILNSMRNYSSLILSNLTGGFSEVNYKLSEVNESLMNANAREINILGNINSTLNRVSGDLANINSSVTLISLEFAGIYQVYGAPNAVLGASQYVIFSFNNLTLVSSLLISVTLVNESAYVYCYTVPGTGIYITAASVVNATGTVTLRIVNYPCWQVTVYAPGAVLNWFSGIVMYQG